MRPASDQHAGGRGTAHDQAAGADSTDWAQTLELYGLLELAGDPAGAHEHYLRAAKRTSSIPEHRYLQSTAAKFLPHGK
ncbi:hypothetical protein [Amycolatopsis rubida]|uniref:RNA polymerase sigma-70 factor, ECF subfamily n=1 Tax=Amycolatopsis rubida TaxID=112413 RepID=A0A1I5YTB9_9PSEU|nr:hypothetical protein SAMN05421854_11312 [Amycolatopsis rubida]